MALMRSTAAFSAMTLLSRVAGLVRDMLQAALFGAGPAADAFVIAYRIPNYLRRIFAEGSFAQAFVPVFAQLRAEGNEAALKDFVDHVAGMLCAAVLVVTGVGMLAAPVLVAALAPGTLDEPGKFELTAQMLRITFPYLFFISLAALAAGVLNSLNRFALPAVTPVLHNLTLILAMLMLAPRFGEPIKALAWGVLVAGALQVALLWPSLRRHGLMPRPRLRWRHPGVSRVFRLMLPTLFSSSVAQLNLVVGTLFASLLATGSQVWLYMAERLSEFPLGLFGVAVGTVILPHLSGRHAATDARGYSHALDWGLRLVVLVALPAALGLALLAEPLTVTIFRYGRFSPEDARMAALALQAMSLGVPAFMLTKVLAPAFFARQDTRTPMRAAVITVVANLVLTVAIVTPLWLGQVRGAHTGIALATSLAGMLNAALLWRWLRRTGLYRPEPGWSRLLLRAGLACLVMALVVLALRGHVGDWMQLQAPERVAWLLAAVALGALAYGGALLIAGLRPRHLREP
ncbi:MAG TPA: murein biosynthesis integral membrane protein MurJ [Xanthomonadaceae bacterium]|nr:murein biosynthesis integral membrane protein MurJ [Xanthomonadaceae bacterium]